MVFWVNFWQLAILFFSFQKCDKGIAFWGY
jgi:hypothetical protein